jgi:hypothetical protein
MSDPRFEPTTASMVPYGYPEPGRPFVLTAHPCEHVLRVPLHAGALVPHHAAWDVRDALEMLIGHRWAPITWGSLRAAARATMSKTASVTTGPGNGCLAWKYIACEVLP